MGRVLLIGAQGELARTLCADGVLRDDQIDFCAGNIEALHSIRGRALDVVVTDPVTPLREELALARELRGARPGLRIIALAPAASREEVIAALRAHVFACFSAPFEYGEIVDAVREALNVSDWHDGIEVTSGLADWFTIRVSCRRLSAERLVRFMAEYQRELPDTERDLLIAAFREMLLNAMEHGGGFDPEKVIEVTAARTQRAIVYHFRDPGPGFNREEIPHAARSPEPEEAVNSALRRAELGLRPGGFGMLIARQIADELVYNERGNEVLLIKHLS